jgi:RNA-directed DNA polymerase
METNKNEPLWTYRNNINVIKTEIVSLSRDKHGGVDAMKYNPMKDCLHQKPVYRPCGDRYKGGVNISRALIGNLGTFMPMLREKSKWKNHKEQKTNAAYRGGTTRSSDESSQLRGSEGVVLSSSDQGTTKREESKTGAKPYEIPIDKVKEAYHIVKENAGTAGMDGIDLKEFEKNLEGNLYKIWNRMSSGSYFPQPVRAVNIPKKNGETRTLGIPTIADRIAQTTAKFYLEPMIEPAFHVDSYGYRPGKSAIDAVSVARRRCWENDWVIVFDIKGLFDNIDHKMLMELVKKFTNIPWLILYIERWLKAPMQMSDGTLKEREAGTPQGGVISPLLANLFMHHAFDAWMAETLPYNPFERFADDGIVHCKSLKQAKYLRSIIGNQLKAWKLQMHPYKTHIVYCKDDNRRETYPITSFDFLGYTFRSRRSKSKYGKYFVSFIPAVSNASKKEMRRKIHEWRMHLQPDKSLEDLAEMFNPAIRGWINYFQKFYKSETYSVLNYMNCALVLWAKRKYKKLYGHRKKANQWMKMIAMREPELFVQWKLGILPG